MRDSAIVAAIVAGDPAGLAAAYDRYGAALHAYCRSLLAEPADAADAVQDTYVIAAAKLAGLRDPDRLRPWLYAVARNECYRRLRARARTTSLDEAGEMTDPSAEMGTGARRDELHDLVHAAIAGLNPGDREIIELNLRHELDGADLAGALGVKPNQAHALASRARSQLERSLGALLVARSGRDSCPQLRELLAGWDGELTVLLRKRVSRHVEQCEECGARKRRELSPAMLASVLPLVAVPAGLRQQVLRLVADPAPDAAAYRERLVARAGRFRADGFPVPAGPAAGRRPGSRRLLAAAAAAAGVLIVAAATVAWSARHVAATVALVPHSSRPSAPASPPGSARAAATVSPPVSAALPPAAAPLPSFSPAPSPASPGPSHRPSPGPSPTVSRTPTPTSSTTAAPGTLTVAPGTIRLAQPPAGGPYTGTFTLTAEGGPVAAFTIAVPQADAAGLTVTPASGSLAAGQSVTVTVTAAGNGPPSYVTALTVNPGQLSVTVEYPPQG